MKTRNMRVWVSKRVPWEGEKDQMCVVESHNALRVGAWGQLHDMGCPCKEPGRPKLGNVCFDR